MRRKKRFSIKMVALGLAVVAFSASPAQAVLDEGAYGNQPMYTQPLVTADDVKHPTPVTTPQLVTADDITHPSLVPSQPTVVASDDGFQIGTLGISGIVLLLGAAGVFVAVHQTRKGKLASA